MANPTSKLLAKSAQQFCLTDGQPITEKCADVGKPLVSEQPDWEHIKNWD